MNSWDEILVLCFISCLIQYLLCLLSYFNLLKRIKYLKIPWKSQCFINVSYFNNRRCCARGHGLMGNIGGRRMVGLDDLKDLLQPWWFCDNIKLHVGAADSREWYFSPISAEKNNLRWLSSHYYSVSPQTEMRNMNKQYLKLWWSWRFGVEEVAWFIVPIIYGLLIETNKQKLHQTCKLSK